VKKHNIFDTMEKTLNEKRELPKKSPPYGDGTAAKKIVEIMTCGAI